MRFFPISLSIRFRERLNKAPRYTEIEKLTMDTDFHGQEIRIGVPYQFTEESIGSNFARIAEWVKSVSIETCGTSMPVADTDEISGRYLRPSLTMPFTSSSSQQADKLKNTVVPPASPCFHPLESHSIPNRPVCMECFPTQRLCNICPHTCHIPQTPSMPLSHLPETDFEPRPQPHEERPLNLPRTQQTRPRRGRSVPPTSLKISHLSATVEEAQLHTISQNSSWSHKQTETSETAGSYSVENSGVLDVGVSIKTSTYDYQISPLRRPDGSSNPQLNHETQVENARPHSAGHQTESLARTTDNIGKAKRLPLLSHFRTTTKKSSMRLLQQENSIPEQLPNSINTNRPFVCGSVVHTPRKFFSPEVQKKSSITSPVPPHRQEIGDENFSKLDRSLSFCSSDESCHSCERHEFFRASVATRQLIAERLNVERTRPMFATQKLLPESNQKGELKTPRNRVGTKKFKTINV